MWLKTVDRNTYLNDAHILYSSEPRSIELLKNNYAGYYMAYYP